MSAIALKCTCGACPICLDRRRKRQRYRADPEPMRAAKREWRKANPGASTETCRRYRAANPEKAKARALLQTAVSAGRIVRPSACASCGNSPVDVLGRTLIQAHHDDYARPYDVRWLCVKCHGETHVKANEGR